MSTETQSRSVFGYHNGAAQVFGDPLALWRRFVVACQGDAEGFLRATQDQTDPARAAEAAGRVVAAVREVFGLQPCDLATGQGATDDHAIATAEKFFDFLTEHWGQTTPTRTA